MTLSSDKYLVCNVLLSAVSKLADWLCSIGLVLNSAKMQALFIQPRGRFNAMPGIYCNDIRQSVTTTAKYLGALVDDQLFWQPHVEQFVRKVSVAVGQLWRHGRALSITARRLWYIAIIQSRFTYASNSFFPCLTKQLVTRLLKVSMSGVRAIFQLHGAVATGPLRTRLSLYSVEHLFIYKVLQFVFRCLSSSARSLFLPYFKLISADPVVHVDCPFTRGQATQLLHIPFLPGQSGRHTMHFLGSSLWNALSDHIIIIPNLALFKSSISKIIFSRPKSGIFDKN